MSTLQKIEFDEPFALESGAILPSLELAYTTHGRLSADRDNVVWICHALTADSDPAGWWSILVGPGRIFDPEKYFIVCANMLGSCYGSSGPASINPETGRRYGLSFPRTTIRDCVRAFIELRRRLELPSLHVCIGGSMGGQMALEWSIMEPDIIINSVNIAASAEHSPWGKAFNAAQRMAIESDQSWSDSFKRSGCDGLKAARAVAMLSYRNYETFGRTQADAPEMADDTRSSTYMQHQGNKLAKRFNAQSYWHLTRTMDSHHIGRGRGDTAEILRAIKARTLVIGISSDILFPLKEQRFLAEHIPGARLSVIDSPYGHDGFLVEGRQLESSIGHFLERAGQMDTEGNVDSVAAENKNRTIIPSSDGDRKYNRIPCALLGGSGIVGQTFAWLLADHPWFEVVAISTSEKHIGRRLSEMNWRLPVSAKSISSLPMGSLDQALDDVGKYRIAFSALPPEIAGEVEPRLREAGIYVFSNSSAMRSNSRVPILIPDVNPDALDLIHDQGFPSGGFVVTNSNCVVAGLAVALAPLRPWIIRSVTVSTSQSLSGAGLPGPAALEMNGNIIPYIANEETKIACELGKILECEFEVRATCMRAPVPFGHIASVWVELEESISLDEIETVFGRPHELGVELPSLPKNAIVTSRATDFPQPLISFSGEPAGMQVFIGRIEVRERTVRFVMLVNNLVRGAAGGSIANAELFVRRYAERV